MCVPEEFNDRRPLGGILSLMLLLTSRSIATESGASSVEKYRISCRLSSSKSAKSCLVKVVTGRFSESLTVTGTNTTSTLTRRGVLCGIGAVRPSAGVVSGVDSALLRLRCGERCTSSADCPRVKQTRKSVDAHRARKRIPIVRATVRVFSTAFQEGGGPTTGCIIYGRMFLFNGIVDTTQS
jgi:hypothetical protein